MTFRTHRMLQISAFYMDQAPNTGLGRMILCQGLRDGGRRELRCTTTKRQTRRQFIGHTHRGAERAGISFGFRRPDMPNLKLSSINSARP